MSATLPTRNSVLVESPYGLRCFAMRVGDITASPDPVLVVPTHGKGHIHPEGAVLSAVERRFGARFDQLELLTMGTDPVSTYRLADGSRGSFPGREILVVRIPGRQSVEAHGGDPLAVFGDALWSLFGALAALELRRDGLTAVSLPLLAGTRGYDTRDLMRLLLHHALGFLRGARQVAAVNFHLVNDDAIREWSPIMDDVLGRQSIDAATSGIVSALRSELIAMLSNGALTAAWPADYKPVLTALHEKLSAQKLPLQGLATEGRRLVEVLIGEMPEAKYATNPKGGPPSLYDCIAEVRKRQKVAPWIIAHCDCLRHIGNRESHVSTQPSYRPPELTESDLPALLSSIHRLLQFRMEWAPPAPEGDWFEEDSFDGSVGG